ncbi:hypothetical protein GCM10011586_24730 [Silvibacterium dinghuense]|nr:hypothetical protein GCM10011586_24730 [Silvibacterium dinghuense]
MAFPRNDTRCMILPPGNVTWREIFAREFPHIKLRENKRFSGEFSAVNLALIPRSRHRFFSLSLPIGELLVDGGGSLIWPDLDPLCREYSRLNRCTVVWTGYYDPAYCQYPEISAWENGSLIRKHAPGLREKTESYLRKGYITQEQFDMFLDRSRTVGDPLLCEQNPTALSILACYGWTREKYTQSGWKSVTTDFD